MDPKPTTPLTENGEHKPAEIQADGQPRDSANRWSTAVRSWVDEFQLNGHGHYLPAFDRLLKDTLS
jgi:hypothetical protein